MTSAQYVGRFAPSPTGPLHFGSLLAAMASYCDARHSNGLWHLRIDDIDPPREATGASTGIQKTLKAFGFEWDGAVIFQSEHTEHYKLELQRLNDLAVLFPCNCTRTQLTNHSVYPGYCNPSAANPVRTRTDAAQMVQEKIMHGDVDHAIRISINDSITFSDSIQGPQVFSNSELRGTTGNAIGDTIVVRRDDLFAYALACAIDDADGISHVVRGCDLISTTASQLAIMNELKLQQPNYSHIPVAVNSDQQKLSKQTRAEALDSMPILPTLFNAWQFLGQKEFAASSIGAFWQTAIETWCIDSVPKQSQQATPI